MEAQSLEDFGVRKYLAERALVVTGLPPEKGMLDVGGASVADSGSTEIRHGVLMNSEHWQGRNQRLCAALAACLLAEPCLG